MVTLRNFALVAMMAANRVSLPRVNCIMCAINEIYVLFANVRVCIDSQIIGLIFRDWCDQSL